MTTPQNWGGKDYGEHVWTGKFSPAPHGAQVLVTTALKHGNAVTVHNQAIVLSPNGDPFGVEATVTMRVVAFAPPAPPETDKERRRRLIAQTLAGQLGLAADDQQTSTVQALMEALDGEWVEDCDLDHEPEL